MISVYHHSASSDLSTNPYGKNWVTGSFFKKESSTSPWMKPWQVNRPAFNSHPCFCPLRPATHIEYWVWLHLMPPGYSYVKDLGLRGLRVRVQLVSLVLLVPSPFVFQKRVKSWSQSSRLLISYCSWISCYPSCFKQWGTVKTIFKKTSKSCKYPQQVKTTSSSPPKPSKSSPNNVAPQPLRSRAVSAHSWARLGAKSDVAPDVFPRFSWFISASIGCVNPKSKSRAEGGWNWAGGMLLMVVDWSALWIVCFWIVLSYGGSCIVCFCLFSAVFLHLLWDFVVLMFVILYSLCFYLTCPFYAWKWPRFAFLPGSDRLVPVLGIPAATRP